MNICIIDIVLFEHTVLVLSVQFGNILAVHIVHVLSADYFVTNIFLQCFTIKVFLCVPFVNRSNILAQPLNSNGETEQYLFTN